MNDVEQTFGDFREYFEDINYRFVNNLNTEKKSLHLCLINHADETLKTVPSKRQKTIKHKSE